MVTPRCGDYPRETTMAKHAHVFTRSKPTATVETCPCGKFRHTEHNTNPVIVEQPVNRQEAK